MERWRLSLPLILGSLTSTEGFLGRFRRLGFRLLGLFRGSFSGGCLLCGDFARLLLVGSLRGFAGTGGDLKETG